ncbi:MAG: LysR family transcriptional regulator [Eubacteriales bacterium]|nr:LysR family transcriptional regulator [Eubacteriales bacterium]
MNDRQLHSFITAADAGSFSKAAALSHISTTAFLQQIQLLEADIGFRLFHRTPRGITLTSAGASFYKDAAKILKLYASACERGKSIETAEALSFRVAYSEEAIPGFLLSALNACRHAHPEIKVDFISVPFSDYFDALSGDFADIAAIAEPTDDRLQDIAFYPLRQDFYSFCMRPEHPLSAQTSLSAEQLQKYTVLCGNYDYLKVPFRENLKQYGIHPKQVDTEYTMSFRTGQLFSDELFVIHSMWSQAYTRFFNVVPSTIPAGRVGVIYRTPASMAITGFLPYLQQEAEEQHQRL